MKSFHQTLFDSKTSEKIKKIMKLLTKREISKPDKVFNLHIEHDHNYIVNNAVVSNCHSSKADSLKSLLTGIFSNVPIRWGLTGTVPKDPYEAKSLTVSIGNVMGKLAASDLQDKGVLAKCHVKIIQLQDYAEFKSYPSELKYLLENEERVATIAKLINDISVSGNTLVLVDRISVGEKLNTLVANSVFVSGETKNKDRKAEYDSIRESTDKVIIATYQIAAVGINIPRLFNVVLIEGGKSFVRTIQSIGRGLRRAEDKDFVQIWDITSSCKFSKRHFAERKKYYTEVNYPFSIEKLEYKK